MSRYNYNDLPAVVRYGREVFLDQVWRYRPGEHVTILGPTGNGKTHLAQALLERTCSPELPAVSLILKPRDATVAKWAKSAGFRKTAAWPPAPPIFGTQKPNGWVVWPRFSYDPARDDPQHYRLFRTAILDSYRKGNRVLFADETVGLQELGLTDELRAVWRQGRSMKCGLWAASQTPTHISPLAYSQAQHLFLGYISDKRAQERFGEISGMDEYLIRHTVKNLKRHEWLYIRQEDRTLCVVEK